MNKTELTDALASRTGMSKKAAGEAIDGLFGTDDGIIATELKNGGEVKITGFGSFGTHETKAKTGRNPHTGEPLPIPAGTRVGFKAGEGLKKSVK